MIFTDCVLNMTDYRKSVEFAVIFLYNVIHKEVFGYAGRNKDR